MKDYNKIFVISLPRHGTTTMFNALGMMGIKLAHLGKIYGEENPLNYNVERLSDIAKQTKSNDFNYTVLRQCDGMADVPVPCVFEELDKMFPCSLFIHVRRSLESWLSSYEKMSVGMDLVEKDKPDQRLIEALRFFRKHYYGVENFDQEAMKKGYARHYNRVANHFSGKESCLLDVELERLTPDEGFGILCEFLECEEPSEPFPHSNEHSTMPVNAFLENNK